MSDPVIRAENLSKQYRLGGSAAPYATLREGLARVFKPRRRQTPAAERAGARQARHVWALRDISLRVEQGEVVGIIGRNGAGKSTLLKVLSRITTPTAGRAEILGRVGSLLEVGTGFHPELTGRENAYLNGAILGMRRREIQDAFDEIVAFAGIEEFIDTPVKHYSSGMYMRLAFSVAAHLQPEILLVDEVLAVGDAAFQKKCLGKMGDIARAGRTVLFVSHNMTAVKQLCSRAVLLDAGRIARDGEVAEVVTAYLAMVSESSGERTWSDPHAAPGSDRVRLHAVRIVSKGQVTAEVDIDQDVKVEVEFWNFIPGIRRLCTNIYLLDSTGGTVLSTADTPAANLLPEEWFHRSRPAGLFRATCTLPGNFLNEGHYYISVYLITLGPLSIEARAEQVLAFTVFDTGVLREPGGGARWDGVVRVRLPWRTEVLASAAEWGDRGPHV